MGSEPGLPPLHAGWGARVRQELLGHSTEPHATLSPCLPGPAVVSHGLLARLRTRPSVNRNTTVKASTVTPHLFFLQIPVKKNKRFFFPFT